ncbi:MAG: diguanylate cyclase [Ruthenibacterium sp.]
MKYKKITVRIIGVLLLFAVVMVTIWDFSNQVQHALTSETYRTLSEVSKTYNKVFNDRISNTIATMNMLTNHFAELHSTSKDEVMDILQSAVDAGGFTKMAICGADGVSMSNDGVMADVFQRDYFKKAMSGKADVSEPLTIGTSDEESIIVAVPVRSHGVVKGVLFGGYPLTVAGDHLLDTTYYSEGYGYIVAPSGAIILSSDHSDKMVDGDNLFNFFKKTTFTDFSMAKLATAIANGESGSFAFRYEGQRRFISFTPAHINDWYTFSLSSDAPMLQDEKVNKQIVFRLLIKLAGVTFIVLFWIICSNRRNNKKLLKQEEELRLSEKRFSVAINASSGALFELDIRRQVYTHFENALRVFGVSAEKIMADTRPFSALPHDEFGDAVNHYFYHPDDCAAIKTAMQKLAYNTTTSYEARLRRHDNSYRWCRADVSLTYDTAGAPSHLVGFLSDIDAVKKQAIFSENQAQKDPMTGLYNKVAMATLSNKGLREYPYGRHALMVLDIDNFKGINDTLGHAFGDLALIDVCTKLSSAFRNSDIVGRIGGDEFAVLMKNIPDIESVRSKGTELSVLFRQTHVAGKECKISCSIGIVVTDINEEGKAESFETLYRKADAALYQAKQNGKNQFVLYQASDAAFYPIESEKADDGDCKNKIDVIEAM